MTKLSVNINKVATLRNARGGNNPDVCRFALDCEALGGEGITVHPRPDERHIRRSDVFALRPLLRTEFNIEGYPSREFIDLVLQVKPAQVTLVPDAPDQITSNHGWDTVVHQEFLSEVVGAFKEAGIRTSVFVDPDVTMVEYAAGREAAIAPYVEAAHAAKKFGLGLNAGHDLSLDNLAYFAQHVPHLDEVSIGHALICDALYLGLAETIRRYKQCLTIGN